MDCPDCSVANEDDSLFCESCGSALDRSCRHCGGLCRPTARFCRQCGQPLDDAIGRPTIRATDSPPTASARPRAPVDYTPRHLAEKILRSKHALEGERKQVTVLFADIKGSMDLAAKLGAETWHGLLERFFEILNEGVHRFEGTVNQYTGDGIMALFGAPIAHEDHAQRACYAALHLRATLRSFSQEIKRQHGVDFSVRIGLNSGDVVVGKIGDDLRMDYTAQGHTVGLAKRMESLASGGSVYLSAATARLVGGYFELEDLGEFAVKGADSPITVHELLGAGSLRTRFDVSRERGLARFVGRGAEMKVLDDALEQAARGNGQVVGLVADAGTGKSRLSFEFVEHCRARGIRVDEGRCLAHGRNIPFVPVLEVIRSYFGIAQQDDDRTAREKVAGRLLLLNEAYRDVLPLVFEFLGIPDPARPAPSLPPEARQRQLFGVLRSITQAGGGLGHAASVILIEDLHWIDGGSEAWIAEWVDATAGSRTLLLLNFRPEYHAPWMQRAHYQQIALAPLTPEAIRELLVELLGTDPSTEGLAERIHAHTAGNPFFAEEAVQSLIESGQLAGVRGRYHLSRPIERLDVPPSVQGVLAARMDRLVERDKHVLQVASVIGKNFREPVLSAVVALPDRDLSEALASLRTGEFLHQVSLYPVAEHTFKHPLTQQVALESMLSERRRSLHAAVARVLEAQSLDLDEDAALLATHWNEANDPLTAGAWHLRAAEWIGARDVHEVAKHAWSVIDGLRAREDEPGASALLAVASARLMNLGWRLGMDRAQGEQVHLDGRRWAQAVGDVGVEAQLAGGHAALLAITGELEACVERGAEFAQLAARSGDRELQMVEHGWISYPRFVMGRLTEGLARVEAAMAEAERNPELGMRFLGASLKGIMLSWQVLVHTRMSPLRVVDDLLERGLRWTRQRGELENECLVLTEYAAAVPLCLGESVRSSAFARQAMVMAEDLASPILKLSGLRGLANCLLAAGEPGDALEVLDEHQALSTRFGVDLQFFPMVLATRAEAQCALGRLGEGLANAHRAVAEAERIRAGLLLPDALHALSVAHLARGEFGESDRALDRMEAAARESGAVNHLPRCLWRRADGMQGRGDVEGRKRLLRAAWTGFEASGAAAYAQQVAHELGPDSHPTT